MNNFIFSILNKYNQYNQNINNLNIIRDLSIIKYYNPFNYYCITSNISSNGYFSKIYNIYNIDNKNEYILKEYKEYDSSALTEIKILSNYNHPHLVKLYETYYFYSD